MGKLKDIAALIGRLGVGIVCYGAAQLRLRARVDDALDVFAVHGVGGAFGAVATGVFASTAINAAAFDGLLAGNAGQVVTQLMAVVVVGAYSAVMTGAVLFLVNLVTPIRVAGDVEETGLDLAQHGEVAYQP